MKRFLVFLIIVVLLGGGAFFLTKKPQVKSFFLSLKEKPTEPEEAPPPLAKSEVEPASKVVKTEQRKAVEKEVSVVTTVEKKIPVTKVKQPVMKEIDTDGDGIPDTFVMKGTPRSIPATPKKIPERIPEGLIAAYCYHVCDGDTIEVKLRSGAKKKIRLVGIDTYETREGKRLQRQANDAGVSIEKAKKLGLEAKKYVTDRCLKKTVFLDIDDESPLDYYDRTLALVYTANTSYKIPSNSLNAVLLQKGYADVLYIPPSEFDPDSW
jgi:endonuclease YncB( thermonuclease family)